MSPLLRQLLNDPEKPLSAVALKYRMTAVQISLDAIQNKTANADHWRLLVEVLNTVFAFNKRNDEYELSQDVTVEHSAAQDAFVALETRKPACFTPDELEAVKTVIQIYSDILESAPAREVSKVDAYVEKTWNRAHTVSTPKFCSKKKKKSKR